MTDLIRNLCERMAQGLELDPRLLANRLGTVTGTGSGSSINVVPSDVSFSAVEVSVNGETGATGMVRLVPAGGLSLAVLRDSLGPYEESPRLHPFDTRKFVFAPHDESSHPFAVEVVAYVSAPGAQVAEEAPVEKLLLFCSPASAEDEEVAEQKPLWQRFLDQPARFGVRALREATLDEVRTELQAALGLQLIPLDEDEPAFGCAVPAGELRLSASQAENPQMHVFNFTGVPPTNSNGLPLQAETISDALAEQLRTSDCDWYVPDKLELLDEGGVLGERLLDRDTLVSILAPFWLAWFSGEDRDAGIKLFSGIAEMWVTAARRTADPIDAVKRRKADFSGWALYVPPQSRLRVLASYAIHLQLSLIEEELAELKEMTVAERGAIANLATRLADWREVVVQLDEAVRKTGATSIRSQYNDVLASIDELTGGSA